MSTLTKQPVRPEDRGWNREKVHAMVDELTRHNFQVITNWNCVSAFEYLLTFHPSPESDASITLSVSIADWQTGSDVAINTMITLPTKERCRGYGKRAIDVLVGWATRHGFREIRAVQVSDSNAERFWQKNQFVRLPEPNPTGDYVRILAR